MRDSDVRSCGVWLADEAATAELGARLAPLLPHTGTIYMAGDLGAGKTSLVRAILRAFGETGPVPSPTYTLVETYTPGDRTVQHFDLYRLADPEEFEYIGGHDLAAEPALRFIEWPQRGAGEVPAADLTMTLAVRGEGRSLHVSGAATSVLERICNALNR